MSTYRLPTSMFPSSARPPSQSHILTSDITDRQATYSEPFVPTVYHPSREQQSSQRRYHGPVPGLYTRGPSGVTQRDTIDDSLSQKTSETDGRTLSGKRMAALAEVDSAKFSWFHFKVIFIAGIGFFVDAYDIFSINIASTMLAYVHTQGNCVRFPGSQNAAIKAATPVGNLLGQIGFGVLADRVGRKRTYGIELILVIVGALGQALISDDRLGTINIVGTLFLWRFIMGLGVGGDYPLSAVISSEFAPTHIRGRMLTAVFANQGWGQLSASVVGCVLSLIFGRHFHEESPTDPQVLMAIDRAWRILVSLGCIPAAIGIYTRLTIPETPRFTMDIERNVRQAVIDIDEFLKTGGFHVDPDSVVVRVMSPRASPRDFSRYFSRWENLKILIGCAYSWFAIDITFYGLGLNTDTFFNAIGFVAPPNGINASVSQCKWTPSDIVSTGSTPSSLLGFQDAHAVFTYLVNLCVANMLLSAAGLIPGYWATFLLIDHPKVGRRPIQLLGFSVLTVMFLVMGLVFHPLVGDSPPRADSLFALSAGAKGFIALFCIVSFFQNFGPNTTTFVVPGELFPTRYRTTCHGISAASGKVGAIISQFALALPIHRVENILFAYVPFVLSGVLSTLLLPETRVTTLEDNSREDQETFIQGTVQRKISFPG